MRRRKISDKGVGSRVFVTTGRLSLLTPSNPPPCLKFFFCAFKVNLGLVRSYVTLAILPHTSSWGSVLLDKHRDNFIFTINRSTETLNGTSKEAGLVVNVEKTK
jgi:hypothetical protein